MEPSILVRPDLGMGSHKTLRNRSFIGTSLKDAAGKEVAFEDCDFSYSVVDRCYFHKASFVRCKFIGTRFIATNFRSSIFEQCDFSYADFDRCVVPSNQILANLPTFPNVRLELLNNLRANLRSVGDSRHESKVLWRIIDTELEHWRLVGWGVGGYYKKYSRWERLNARFAYLRLLAERYIWGHGESLVRLGLATLIVLIFLSLAATLNLTGVSTLSLDSLLSLWYQKSIFIFQLFVDLPTVTSEQVNESPIVSTMAVLIRYTTVGLAIPILYRYIAKR